MARPFLSFSLTWLEWIVIAGLLLIGASFFLPPIEQGRTAARRTMTQINLKRLGTAILQHHDKFREQSSDRSSDMEERSLHGWAAFAADQLGDLPNIQNRAWHDAVDWTQPWDAAVNQPAYRGIGPSPLVLVNPGVQPERSLDGYQLTHFAANQHLIHPSRAISLSEFPSRTTTALIGEAYDNFLPFGSPENWRDVTLKLKSSADSFGSPVRSETMFLMADGSVKSLAENTDQQVLMQFAGSAPQVTSANLLPKRTTPTRRTDPPHQGKNAN